MDSLHKPCTIAEGLGKQEVWAKAQRPIESRKRFTDNLWRVRVRANGGQKTDQQPLLCSTTAEVGGQEVEDVLD